MTDQPSYFCIINLGDANPFEYGGAFVCIDRRGSYDPILLIYEEKTKKRFEVTLEKCFPIFEGGKITHVGSNIFHPHLKEWFSKDLKSVADFISLPHFEFLALSFSRNVITRASFYNLLINYFGVEEFDQYPYIYESDEEAEKFCDEMLRQIKETKTWKDGYFQI